MNAASKSEFLARHRMYYFGHARVSDPLFEVDTFFDPRDLLQVKYEMLRRVRVDHWSVMRAAREAAFSRTAWYDAMHRWEQSGLAGLLPDPPGPRREGTPRPIIIDVSPDLTEGRAKRGAMVSASEPESIRGIRVTRYCATTDSPAV